MSDLIKDRYARDAAFLRLVDALNKKNRGDRITAAEIVQWTGFEDWRSFGGRIRTWAAQRGYFLEAVPHDGWRVVLPIEHIDQSEKARKSALRKTKKAVKALRDMPAADLSENDLRRRDALMTRNARQLVNAVEDDKEIRKEFKLSDRVPMRIASKSV